MSNINDIIQVKTSDLKVVKKNKQKEWNVEKRVKWRETFEAIIEKLKIGSR